MFVAGLRHIDRVRGAGWLDCPNCGEHASQDVVDDMRFLGLLGYRLTPVGRRRVLVCRRCGFRRAATEAELTQLNTSGRSLERAWLLPIGLLPFAAAAAATIFLLGRHPATIEDTLTFTHDTAQPVAPMSLRRPLSWNATPETDATPPAYIVSDPTERMVISLRRITDSDSLAQLLAQHYMDDNGINDLGVPPSPPGATTVEIAGSTALMIHFSYTSTGEPAQITLYALFHDGIGYTLTYVAKGTAQFSILDQVAGTVNASLSFTATETPAPCPSPTPGPGATPEPGLPGFATSPQPCAA
ncbi:MAG: hypothetical protein ACREQ5_35960, partial [Candidatus Dormibacteria bacterium]